MAIVVLISGNGSNLQAIIDAGIPVAAVISDKADAFGLTRAEKAGIPTHTLKRQNHSSREAFDEALAETIDQFKPSLVVLAGFMRILSENFVDHFYGKLINIHPSLLPKYRGLDTHRRVLEAGDQFHGISVHYVSRNLDAGPIIAQAQIEINPGDTESKLKSRIQKLEHQFYPDIITKIRAKRISLAQDQVVFDGKPLARTGIMLNL